MSTHAIAEIPCRQFVELVTDYLEGRLAAARVEQIDAHIADCHGCTTYLEQMRFTLRALGRIPEETISEAARQTLMHAFGERHSAT
jgi:anti-sigma factor RsiW